MFLLLPTGSGPWGIGKVCGERAAQPSLAHGLGRICCTLTSLGCQGGVDAGTRRKKIFQQAKDAISMGASLHILA